MSECSLNRPAGSDPITFALTPISASRRTAIFVKDTAEALLVSGSMSVLVAALIVHLVPGPNMGEAEGQVNAGEGLPTL